MLAGLAGLAIGVVPALHASLTRPDATLREHAGSLSRLEALAAAPPRVDRQRGRAGDHPARRRGPAPPQLCLDAIDRSGVQSRSRADHAADAAAAEVQGRGNQRVLRRPRPTRPSPAWCRAQRRGLAVSAAPDLHDPHPCRRRRVGERGRAAVGQLHAGDARVLRRARAFDCGPGARSTHAIDPARRARWSSTTRSHVDTSAQGNPIGTSRVPVR